MDKLELEDSVFQASRQYLQELYGDFARIEEQKDSPDAAIRLMQKADGVDVTIGIEITCVDNQGDMQYFNDEKFSREITKTQIEDCIRGEVPSQPMKKSSISMEKDYLYKTIVEQKLSKYDSYRAVVDFNELIILVFSNFIVGNEKYFHNYHVPWTSYLLNESKFPFDKVIFVDRLKNKCIMIFDKKNPCLSPPKANPDKELGYTYIQSGFIPVNTTVNLDGLFKNKPLVEKKKGKRKKR